MLSTTSAIPSHTSQGVVSPNTPNRRTSAALGERIQEDPSADCQRCCGGGVERRAEEHEDEETQVEGCVRCVFRLHQGCHRQGICPEEKKSSYASRTSCAGCAQKVRTAVVTVGLPPVTPGASLLREGHRSKSEQPSSTAWRRRKGSPLEPVDVARGAGIGDISAGAGALARTAYPRGTADTMPHVAGTMF